MVDDKDEGSGSVSQRRVFVRISSDLQLEFTLDGVSYKEGNYTVDISIGGIAFVTEKKLKLEDLILLRIPAENPYFEGYGKVVWILVNDNNYKVGIEFDKVGMTGETIDGLHKLLVEVRSNEPDQEQPE